MKRIIYRARTIDGDASRELTLPGRFGWALAQLVKAGEGGCTPITHPGPRWSGYVHRLRHDWGLSIETVHEGHAGPFPGKHARYILRSAVVVLEDEPS